MYEPMPELQALLSELYALHRFGIKPGLDPIRDLLASTGNPHTRYKTIHVAGTNGKGTVSSAIASILREAGLRVGLYTSPHIVRFNERVRIDGIPVADAEIVALWEMLRHDIHRTQATFFEATTAMAFHAFARANVDVAVIEVGLGGRLDATNVLDPDLAVITSIDYDHQQYLGDTLELIAREKAGIMKPGRPVLVAEPRIRLWPLFSDAAHLAGAHLVALDDLIRPVLTITHRDLTTSFEVHRKNASSLLVEKMPLVGDHSVRNATTGIAAALLLNGLGWNISDIAIANGLQNLRHNSGLSGRIHLISAQPEVILDVAHNDAGVAALADALRRCHRENYSFSVVFGAMSDKPVGAMLGSLEPFTAELFCAVPEYERAASAEQLMSAAAEAGHRRAVQCSSVAEAVAKAVESKRPILIVGSFYLAGEAVRAIKDLSVPLLSTL